MSAQSESYSGIEQKRGTLFAIKRQPPKQQPFLVVLEGGIDKPESARVLVDPNAMDSTGHTAIDWYRPSPDGKLVCYTSILPEGGVSVSVMNHDGSEKRRVVKSASKVGATFPNWSSDSKQIIYSFPVSNSLELWIINVDGTGERQLTKFGGTSVCTPSAWSPDGAWISFRKTDERYWSNKERMLKIYSEKPADKRPVWVIRPDGSDATLIEPLRFQMAIDGSRASWKPTER